MAYELQYGFGNLGHLYVSPAHRRKGLAHCAMAALIRKIMLNGKPVYVWITEKNDVSLKLHTDFGFTMTDDAQYMPVQYVEIGSQG